MYRACESKDQTLKKIRALHFQKVTPLLFCSFCVYSKSALRVTATASDVSKVKLIEKSSIGAKTISVLLTLTDSASLWSRCYLLLRPTR